MRTLHINLDANGVAAPAQRAALIASDIVAAALTAFEDAELTKPSMPNQFIHHQIRGPEMTSEQRRSMYEIWLLTKGFQDIARGIRESLEEALFYLDIVANPPKGPITFEMLQDRLNGVRKRVVRPNFPELMAQVNERLASPVQFQQEVLSIQKVRNCLENRGGIVGVQDLDPGDNVLTLSFPRFKFFYMRKGEEIELAPDEPVDARDGQPEVDILARRETHSRVYQLGERITFTAAEFSELAMASSLFAIDLAGKLPKLAAAT